MFFYSSSSTQIFKGTCAGLIFMGDEVTNQKKNGQLLIGGLHCTVSRNYFGAQKESFETLLNVPELGNDPVRKSIKIKFDFDKDKSYIYKSSCCY